MTLLSYGIAMVVAAVVTYFWGFEKSDLERLTAAE